MRAMPTLGFEQIKVSSQALKSKCPEGFVPQVGVICGSGLGGLGERLTNAVHVSYADIPNFAPSTVEGHAGKFTCGELEGKRVVCMVGRLHSYEGHSMQQIALGVRVMKLMGCGTLVVTNASGGLNPDFKVGTIMSIEDHIGIPVMSGFGPLLGRNIPELGPRFPPMSDAYHRPYRKLMLDCAKRLRESQPAIYGDMDVQSGVYCFLAGPAYETRAECRMIRMWGGDTVGMSTVPEVIAAHHAGMKVVGLSLVTNKVVIEREPPVDQEMEHDQEAGKADHTEVLEASRAYTEQVTGLVKEFIRSLEF